MVRDQLKRREITDSRVLSAMGDTPRHLFVPPEWQAVAYRDRPLPIGGGQTISQPYMVALMLQHLALQGTERVLEIGTGSGYQTALLCQLAAQVYSLEYVPELATQANTVLSQLGYRSARIIVGDGGLGLPAYAPYDSIVVAAVRIRFRFIHLWRRTRHKKRCRRTSVKSVTVVKTRFIS
jgi:protein-L-isoaspartate(D-aspartate) O-methyltransferase